MSVLDKAERSLSFLRNADTTKSHDVRVAAGTLGRCLGALGCRPAHSRHYADLLNVAVPTLLKLAANDSAEIRLVGDEALNRVVVGGFPFHAHKINVTLQNEIDHTKSARWNRAALARICLGDSWLRPGVGKIRGQAQTLFTKLANIVRTTNERPIIAESFESNLPRLLTALGDYSTDEELTELAQELMQWIDSPEPSVRRGAAVSLAHLCKHRSCLVPKLLDVVVEKLYPEAADTNGIHGWLGAVRSLLQVNSMTVLMQSGVFTTDDLLELYQLCLLYLESPRVEHNTHNASLECLLALLTGDRARTLARRCRLPDVGRRRGPRSKSRISNRGGHVTSVEASALSDELMSSDIHESLTFRGGLHFGSLSQLQTPMRSTEDLTLKTPDSAASDIDFELSTSEYLSRQLASKLEGMRSEDEDLRSEYLESSVAIADDGVKINIGTMRDEDIPLRYLTRLLASKFLLTGHGGVILDRKVRVSVKASALNCIAAILVQYPQALTMYLDKDADLSKHNVSGSSMGCDSQDNNEFILERNICFQESMSSSFSVDLLNKSSESHAAIHSSRAASKRDLYKSTGAESTDQKSSTKDIPSNILDSKQSATKNDLMMSGQTDSTNPNMTISNFTSNSNMTASNDPLSTEYPQTSSNDVISSSIDLDIKFDHFGESTTNIDNFDPSTKPQNEIRKMSIPNAEVLDAPPKKPLRRTTNNEEVQNNVPDENVQTDYVHEDQHMSDIIVLLENHSDPQIRGLVRIVIGSFLFSALDLSHGDYTRWRPFAQIPKDVGHNLTVDHLVEVIVKGLTDDIHSCVNHSLTALSKILNSLINSSHVGVITTILQALVNVETNSYWLCKVTLCKLYEKMPFERLSIVLPGYHMKTVLIFEVLYRLLADQDQKVRQAASNAVAEITHKIQPVKITKNAVLTETAIGQTELFNFEPKDLALSAMKRDYFLSDLPEHLQDKGVVTNSGNLANVVTELTTRFMESSCKFYSEGLLEALLALSTKWPPWLHQASYMNRGIVELCLDNIDYCNNSVSMSSNLIALATLVYPLDISESMHQKHKDIFENDSEMLKEKWQHLKSEKCWQIAEKFLQVTLKLLNVLAHLIEEINPNMNANKTGIALPGSPVRRKTSDAIPRRTSNASEEDKNAKKRPTSSGNTRANFVGQFVNEPFYMKLYDNLKAVYSNHKLNLEQKSSMFYTFLSNVLDALAIQLEFASDKEFGPLTEEILYYLKTILPIKSDKTVYCVTQLLKCLFGTNMVNQYTDYLSVNSVKLDGGQRNMSFFDNVVMVNSLKSDVNDDSSDGSRRSSVSSNMSQKMRLSVDSKNPRLVFEKQLLEKMEIFARNKSDRKWNTNKKELERYIRMFEPVVIQALKSYTMQNNESLQCSVLGLLNQLLTLRVNYCMLDSDQVFINLLLEQLDLVEQNDIPNSSKLVNSIMTFLVQLSSSKHHSKQLMEIPKLIQMCDGLTASGRRSECASALRPLAARVFWSSRHHSTQQETAVTREVVFYMLHKTMTCAQVLNMVSSVLALSQEHPESYYRWSELAADALLNLLTQRAIELNNRETVVELERLIDLIYKDVLLEQQRVAIILKILFAQPPDQATSALEIKERYLATVMVLLRKIIANVPESEILLTIDILKASFISPSSIFFNVKADIDPLNVQNVNENCVHLLPDVILVRFLFKMLTYLILEFENCNEMECTDLGGESTESGCHKLLYSMAINIVCHVKHMLHLNDGCLFPLTSKTAQSVLHNEQSGLNTGLYSPDENIPLERLNQIILRQSYRIPLFAVHWSHLLIRLKFLEQKYWQSLLGYVRNSPLSSDNGKGQSLSSVLQIGCVMAYCEYFVENGLGETFHLTWLLVNRIHILVSHYKEWVVKAFVEKVHENASASGLLLQAIAARCQSCLKDEFSLNTYHILSKCHETQSGALVFLICRLLGKLELAIATRFAKLGIQRLRMLQAMDTEQICKQLTKEDLQVALEMLQREKAHLRFTSLVTELNCLASSVFDLSPLDMCQDRCINPQYIVTTNADAKWLINQIKTRCCQSYCTQSGIRKDRPQDLALLLQNLTYEELMPILSCSEFDRRILHSTFIKSCDSYIRDFLKVTNAYESREAEKDNLKKQRALDKMREDQITNIDNNILNVATTLTKFRKGIEAEGPKSQFFIPISDNKEMYKFEEKFGNLEISDDEPNEITIPELPALFTTSLTTLEKSLKAILNLFPKQSRPLSQSENFNMTTLDHKVDRYTCRCHQVFQDKLFYQEYCVIQDILSGYLEALHRLYAFLDTLDCDVSEKVIEKLIPASVAKNIAIITVISLQYLSFLIKNKEIIQSPVPADVSFRACSAETEKIVVDDVISLTLKNTSEAMRFNEIWTELNAESNSNRIQSSITCLYAVVRYCVKDTKPLHLKRYVRSPDETNPSDICLNCDKLLTLIEYWESTFYSVDRRCIGQVMCEHSKKPLEELIRAFSRFDLLCNVALIPPLAWPMVDLEGKAENMKVDLPLQAFQDMDVLESFLFRVNFVEHWSKKTFEEVWMCLLAALQGNGTHRAVRGVMQILLGTVPQTRRLGGPRIGYVHCPRDYFDDSNGMQRLRSLVVGMPIYGRLYEQSNLERIPFVSSDAEKYSYGQFSTEYLRLAADITETASFRVRQCLKRVRRYTRVDVQSCLQLLMDVASQMLQSKAPTGLSARCSLISCIVNVSDFFTSASQWHWLAQQMATLTSAEHKYLTQYCVPSQYLLYGLVKALTVLDGAALDETSSVYQKLIKWLNSSSAALRQCALRGCLLLLDTPLQSSQAELSRRQLTTLLAGVCRQFLSPQYRISLYEQSINWSVLFKLVELGNTDLMNLAVDFLLSNTRHQCTDLVVKGITTMIRMNVLPKDLKKSIVVRLVNNRGDYAEHQSLQILMVHLFSAHDKLLSPRLTADVSNMDPDVLMSSMERITLLYQLLRDSAQRESMVAAAGALGYLLRETLPPAATLSRVVIEFLECCRETERHRAGVASDRHKWAARSVLNAEVVFEVFQTAVHQSQLSVVSGWIFEALFHLLGGKISESLQPYCLLCLLVSATGNPNIRKMAPLTFDLLKDGFSSDGCGKREGSRMCFVDRRLLCVVALHSEFTKAQLDKLKELCDGSEVFEDLLNCLSSA